MKKAISIFFALAFALGIAGSAKGENRLVTPVGITQSTADGLYGSLAGEAGWAGTQDFTGGSLLAAIASAANEVMTQGASDTRYPQLAAATNTYTGVYLGPDGTNEAPTWSFASEATGWYLVKAGGKIGLSAESVLVCTINAATLDHDGSLDIGGDATFGGTSFTFTGNEPLLSFTGTGDKTFDTDSGMFVFLDALEVDSVDGIDIFPGGAQDGDLLTVIIGGAPTLRWVQASGKFEFTKGVIQPDSKAGSVAGASFAGNPKVFTVTFGTAFPDANYSISITSAENRTWTYNTKLAASFIINSNANLAFTGDVDWTATVHSDP